MKDAKATHKDDDLWQLRYLPAIYCPFLPPDNTSFLADTPPWEALYNAQ